MLADGSIVEATPDNAHSDLFWALKGGGNSFCIVTRFEVVPYRSPRVWIGSAQYSSEQAPKFLDAVNDFAVYGALGPKAALTPIVSVDPAANKTTYGITKFYDSEIDAPKTWENFSSPHMTPTNDNYKLQPLSTFINDDHGPVTEPLRRKWRVISSIAAPGALIIIHTALVRESAKLAGRANATAGVTFQPIPAELIRQGRLRGGNPQGIDLSRAPYFWTVLQLAWKSDADDEYMHAFAENFTAGVNQDLRAAGMNTEYLFMNYAGEGQPVFQSYGAENLDRLKAIRENYDPLRVFTELMPGGWKVMNASF